MKKYAAEAIGTFALVFCGTGAIVINEETNGAVTHLGVAVAFGLIVMAMIYTLGDISGAHLNPAVSIAFTLAKRFPLKELFPYILSQVSGAVLASLALKCLFPSNDKLGSTLPAGSSSQSFALEFFLSFLLMLVILHAATAGRERGIYAAAVIGSTVLLEALFAGPISGASMNPARSFAPALVSGHTQYLWIYLTATVLGALVAIPVWNYLGKKSAEVNSTAPHT